MDKLIQSLEGRKTFGLCALGIGIIAAVNLHWITIPMEQVNELGNVVTLAAIAALRASK